MIQIVNTNKVNENLKKKYDVKIKTNNSIKNRATTDIVKILYYITSTQ